ncbi:hypothetical protein Anapl_14388 [Anas platyrhynchos]|uniref:Uncharacterized protein n=1 Tax=Anas platyrhynchos TaxID=8839 RepID=R0JWR7_ANAPL|nr:hypothetical protein Anapl_14388 [Anas platyrhynchos]
MLTAERMVGVIVWTVALFLLNICIEEHRYDSRRGKVNKNTKKCPLLTSNENANALKIAIWVHGLPEAPNLPSITLLVYYHLIYATVPGTKTVSQQKAERGK